MRRKAPPPPPPRRLKKRVSVSCGPACGGGGGGSCSSPSQAAVASRRHAPLARSSTSRTRRYATESSRTTRIQVLAAARDWASTRSGLREYTIGQETHPRPADPQRPKHFHAYIKFGKRVDIYDRFHTTIFDLRGDDQRVLHPEIQSVLNTPGDRERVINYDMKEGDYIGELETPLVNDQRREAAETAAREEAAEDGGEGGNGHDAPTAPPDTPSWARMLNKSNNASEGMALLADKAPHIYYMHGWPRRERQRQQRRRVEGDVGLGPR
jgi:hypothetical protein